MVAFRPAIAGLIALCVLLVSPISGFAADWDRFPELESRQHVAIKKRFDGPRYNDLRSCFRRFDSRVGANYFAAMVDVTAASGSRSRDESDAGPFAKALAEAWREDGRVDADDHVVIALGVRNRSVGIHAGDKWTRLGFEGKVIEDTIEGSHFGKHLRRRNYNDALCSLATAVDLRLATLDKHTTRRTTQLQERLPALEKTLGELQEGVEERFGEEHPLGKELRAHLAAARTKLEDAQSRVEDNPIQAAPLADEVDAALDEVPGEFDAFDSKMSRLDEISQEIDALEASIAERPDRDFEGAEAALQRLTECRELAAQIRQHDDGEPWQVRDCQRDAEVHLAESDVHYLYLRRVLPLLAGLLAVALLIGFIAARVLRRRRALGLLEADLDQWQRRLDDAGDRLHRLEASHPCYFAAGRAPWAGQSAELDQRAADPANRVSLLYAKGRELLDEASRLRKKSHPLDVRRVEKALRSLRETSIDFNAGHVHPKQRLQVPLGQAYAASASQLLGDLERSFEQATTGLEEVEAITARLAEQSGRAARAATVANRAVSQRREFGLTADHLTERLHDAMQRYETARRLAHADPAAATAAFEAAADQLEQLGEPAETGNELIERIQGPIAELEESISQKVRQLRFARVDVDKLSVDPKHELDTAEREAKRIVGLVDQGGIQQANDALEALQSRLDRLAHQLDVAKEAKDDIPEVIEALGERGKALKDQLLEVRYSLKRLAPDNNPDAFEQISARLGRFHSRLHRLSKKLAQVKKLHAKQHYLAATDQLDSLRRLVDRAGDVLAEFDQLEDQVDAARGQTEQLLPQCQQSVQTLKSQADQPGVSATLREAISEQFVSLQMIGDQIRAEQAGWLEARDKLVSMQKISTFLSEEIQADLNAYEQARQLAARLDTQLSALTQTATPPEAQAALAGVRELAAGWSARLQEGRSGGRELLGSGQAVARAVGRAERVCDGQAVALSASAHLAYAQARYDAVDAKTYGYGVEADCSPCAAGLAEARSALESGDFARALELAEAAAAQIDLEHARADAAAELAYRQATVHNLGLEESGPDVRFPGQLGQQSSWGTSLASMSEPTGV